jgi:hypothetical protein
LFTEQFNWQPNLDDLSFESIGEVEDIWLERAFEEDGVLEVVKALNRTKALGFDGFTLAFLQACWDVLKEDIMNVFHDFHAKGKFKEVLMLRSLLLFRSNQGLLISRTFDL